MKLDKKSKSQVRAVQAFSMVEEEQLGAHRGKISERHRKIGGAVLP